MKDLLVCARRDIFKYVGKYDVTHIFSLHENRQECLDAIPKHIPEENIHHVRMKDVEDRFDPLAPTLDQVKGVFEFVDTLPDDAVLLVHCEGGISRSPAMLVSIDAYTSGIRDTKLLTQRLIEKHRVSYPNRLILDIASNILDDVYLPDILDDDHFRSLII